MHLEEGEMIQLTCRAGSQVGSVILYVTATDIGFLVYADDRLEADLHGLPQDDTVASFNLREG